MTLSIAEIILQKQPPWEIWKEIFLKNLENNLNAAIVRQYKEECRKSTEFFQLKK